MSTPDFCNGFLEAMRLLNSELTDVYAHFEISRLPDAPNLLEALGLYFERQARERYRPAREYPASAWHIELKDMDGMAGRQMQKICGQWFFCSSAMSAAPLERHYRSNVVTVFLEALSSAFVGHAVWEVQTRPPIWYAMDWNDVAFEKGEERYLMHLSWSD